MVWSGAFHFGDCWAAYRGPAADSTPHAHAAFQVTLAMRDDVAISDTSGKRFTGRALAVRAGAKHQLAPSAALVVILCDPNSAAAALLRPLLRDAEMVVLPADAAARFSPEAALPELMNSFSTDRAPLDPRLLDAMSLVDHEPNIGIAAVADRIGLSVARLRALAQSDLGVPLATWRTWRNLRRAALDLAKGATLADAALAGGFADQAHFARTMRRMTGLSPTAALPPLR